MNRDDILRMAREAGLTSASSKPWGEADVTRYFEAKDALERFAALVAAAEREACAKVCENICEYDAMCDGYYAETYAAAIRARGNT